MSYSHIIGPFWLGGAQLLAPTQFSVFVLAAEELTEPPGDYSGLVIRAHMTDDRNPVNLTRAKQAADNLVAIHRQHPHRQILVTCYAGLNRSALILALTLRKLGMPSGQTIDLLRARRSPEVLHNTTFETWIRQGG